MLLGRKIMIGILAAGMVTSSASVTMFALNDKGVIKLHQDELREYNAQFYSEGSLVFETGKIKKGTAINYGYKNLPTKKRSPDGKIYQCIGWDLTGEGIPDVVPTKIYGDFKANAVFIRLPAIEKLLMDPNLLAKLTQLLQKLNVSLTPEQVKKLMDWLMNLGIDWSSIDMSVIEQLLNLLGIDLQQFMDMLGLDLESLMAFLSVPMFNYTPSSAGPYYFRTQSYGNTFKDNEWTKADYYASSRISEGSVNPLAYSTDKMISANILPSVNFEMTYLNPGDAYPVPCNEVNNTQNVSSDSYSLTSPTEIQPLEGYTYSSRYNTSALGFVPACTYTVNILRLLNFSNEAIAKDELEYREYAKSHYLEVDDKYKDLFTRIINDNGIEKDETYNFLSQILEFYSKNYHFNYMMDAYPVGEDRILYFMNTAKEGIGTHFADSTTMLFRTLGIPARSVSGYVDIASNPGEERTVTAIQAHSWTEIYLDGIGWMTFDASLADDVIPEEYSQYLMNSFETIDPEFGSEKITDLYMEADPLKEYFAGEMFSPEDLSFYIQTENGQIKQIPYTDMTYVSTPDMNIPGEQTITGIIVQGTDVLVAETTINVKPVAPASLSLFEATVNDSVFVNETYYSDPEGIVTFSNGSTCLLSEYGGAVYGPVDTSKIGEQDVKFSVPGYPDVYQNVKINVIGPVSMEIVEYDDVLSVAVGDTYNPYTYAFVTLSNGEIIISEALCNLVHTDVDTSEISTQTCVYSLEDFPDVKDEVEVDVYGPDGLVIYETPDVVNVDYGSEYNPYVTGYVSFSNKTTVELQYFDGEVLHTPLDTTDVGTHEVTFWIKDHEELSCMVNVTVSGPEKLIMDEYDWSIHNVYYDGAYNPSSNGQVLLTNGNYVPLSNFSGVNHTDVDLSTIGETTSTFSLIDFPEITEDVDVLVIGPDHLEIFKTTPVTEVNVGQEYAPPYYNEDSNGIDGYVHFNNGETRSLYDYIFEYTPVDTSSVGTQEVTYFLTDFEGVKEKFDVTVVGPIELHLDDNDSLTKVLVNTPYEPEITGYVYFNNGYYDFDLSHYGELTHTPLDTSEVGTHTVTFSLVDYPNLKYEVTVEVIAPETLEITTELPHAYLDHDYDIPDLVSGMVTMTNGEVHWLGDDPYNFSVSHGSLDTSTKGDKEVIYTLDGYDVSYGAPVTVYAPESVAYVHSYNYDLLQYTDEAHNYWQPNYAYIRYEDGAYFYEYADLDYEFPDTSTIGEKEVTFSLHDHPEVTCETTVCVYGPTSFTLAEGAIQTKYFVGDDYVEPDSLSGVTTLSNGTSTWQDYYFLSGSHVTPVNFDTSAEGEYEVTFTLDGYPGVEGVVPIKVISAPDTPIVGNYITGQNEFEIIPNGTIDFSQVHLYVRYEDGLSREVDTSTGTFTLGSGAPDLSHPGTYYNVPVVYTEIIEDEEPYLSSTTFYIDVTVKNRDAIYLTSSDYPIAKEYDGEVIDLSNALLYIFHLEPNTYDSITDNQFASFESTSLISGSITDTLPGVEVDVMFTFRIYSNPGLENLLPEYFEDGILMFYINGELQTMGVDYSYNGDTIRFIYRLSIVPREVTIQSYSGEVESLSQLNELNDETYGLIADNLLAGHYIDMNVIDWTTPTGQSEFNNTLDVGTIVIRDADGNDVSYLYNINFEAGHVYIVE